MVVINSTKLEARRLTNEIMEIIEEWTRPKQVANYARIAHEVRTKLEAALIANRAFKVDQLLKIMGVDDNGGKSQEQ